MLYAKGKYEDGNFSSNQAYLYVTIIYTASYLMALYALALFFVECRDLLRPFNPFPNFIMINSIIFLIGRVFWFFFTAKSRFIKSLGEAVDFQNCVLYVEMLLAAVGHLYAFPYKEYEGANIGASSNFTGNVAMC